MGQRLQEYIFLFKDLYLHPLTFYRLRYQALTGLLQYILFNAGIISSYSPRRKGGFLKRILELFKNLLVYKVYTFIVPLSVGIDYEVKKSFWKQEFITTNVEVKILSSMYFEYRYHVVLEKK
jgi:hypothetical protein